MPSTPIQPLTEDGFAPFGTVLQTPTRPTDLHSSVNRYWDEPVPFRVTAPPLLGFLEAHWRPFSLDWMEFHRSHTQGFLPLGGAAFVIAVAPPDTPPAELHNEVRAFFLDGTCGVILHERTWHHVLFPMAPKANAIVLLQQGVKEGDMNVSQLETAVELVQVADLP